MKNRLHRDAIQQEQQASKVGKVGGWLVGRTSFSQRQRIAILGILLLILLLLLAILAILFLFFSVVVN